ncbi:MAG TPA: FMN-binding protein [bacterium]|nr:FMN-binding protein [bacterium]
MAAIAAAAVVGPAAVPVHAEVFHSRESALRLAFPDADRVEPVDVMLTREQAERVQRLAGVKPESRMVTAYAGWSGTRPLGWAFLDTHGVRTLPETVMLVVSPDGRIQQTRLLAFHEPPEYRPAEGWFARLTGARLDDDLKLGHGVDGISGATLSAQAVAAAARRVLAVWQVALSPPGPALP